jgi:hypothetical protein
LPEVLPFALVRFDLIYAFSVFTHLSRRAAETARRRCVAGLNRMVSWL